MKRELFKKKKTLARKLMSKVEIKVHVPPFQSKGWKLRSEAIGRRVKKSEKTSKDLLQKH